MGYLYLISYFSKTLLKLKIRYLLNIEHLEMKKLYYFFLFCLTIGSTAFANNEIDSLKNAINDKTISIDSRVDAYIQLTYNLRLKNDPDFNTIVKSGLDLAIKNKDSISYAQLIKNKASFNLTQGKRDSALIQYYQAIGIFERHNKQLEAANTYTVMAKMYRNDDTKRAIGFYDKAYEIYLKEKDESGQAVVLNESGVAYENQGELDEAVRRYTASLEIQQRLNDKVGIGYAMEFLSGAYLKKGEVNKNKEYLLAALEIRKETKDTFALAINHTNLGEFYQNTNENQLAISHVLESNQLAQKINFLDLMAHNYKMLSELYAKQGQDKLALDNMNQHIVLKDSLYNAQKSKQIEEISVKYETEKNKLVIEEQKNKILKRNYAIGISIFLLLGIIGISSLLFKRIQLKNDLKLQQRLIKEQESSAKAVMNAEEEERQRIARDLHDGVGQLMSTAKMNLSSLESYIDFQNEDQKRVFENAIHLVDESCKEVRVVSHNLMPNALLKKSLADAIRNFINKIEKNKLQIHLYIEGLDEKLDQNLESVLYRIVQECVNNVIKHAEATSLDISILKEKGEINLTIEDNGKGFAVKKMANFEGIGLNSIISRVQYLKGTVDFDSAPGEGTLVAINIPLNDESKDE